MIPGVSEKACTDFQNHLDIPIPGNAPPRPRLFRSSQHKGCYPFTVSSQVPDLNSSELATPFQRRGWSPSPNHGWEMMVKESTETLGRWPMFSV